MVLAKVIADFFSSIVFSFDTMQLKGSSTLSIANGNEGHQAVSSGIAEMTVYFEKEMKDLMMEFEEQLKAAVKTVILD